MDPYRLPDTVVPQRYDLVLVPNLDAATFTGELTLTVTVREPVREVLLNAAELAILSAVLVQPDRRDAVAIELDEAAERARLQWDQPVSAGLAVLHLRFSGTLNDRLRGFYRSRFRDSTGHWHWLAATQFEATDARRAFPCFDEPAFKAVFQPTLVVGRELQALSNTRILSCKMEGDRKVVRFAETIPMSTYLVAFIVGPLEASDPVLVGDTPVRVWCTPGKTLLTRFGQEVAVASLRFFEDYYARKYPGDKLDLVAIPDFAAGAMENLGAITFRETALLVDESSATHQEKQRVADVVAHENAHMWFGDLVTMRWWNGLWLNEAFATFMEMLAVDAWKPAWRRWETFAVSRAAALEVDGLHSSRPIEFAVQAPADAEAMFDVLTYEKGASVLRMLEQYLGPPVFQAGVRIYLDRHALGSTDTQDLWQALGEAANLPLPQVLDGWVFRPGYPLITARLAGRQLVLLQQRFCYLPATTDESACTWQVPVQLRISTSGGAESHRLLLTAPEHRLPWPADATFVVINEGGHGFYRVRYDGELLARLLDRLPQLAAVERFNLVNDAWASVLAGLMRLSDYLDLTARCTGERDRNVWSVLLASFTVLTQVVEEADRPSLQRLIRSRLAGAVQDLGWRERRDEDELTGQLRGELLQAAGVLGDDASVQTEAALVLSGGQADASVRAAAIAILAHTGDEIRYNDFLGRFRAATTPQEEQRYLMALARFRQAVLVQRTLNAVLDGTARTQDAPLLLRGLLHGVHSRAQAWVYFQENWEEMARRFPGPGIRRLCEGILGLTSATWEEEARAFFRDHEINLGGRLLEQFLEQLHIRVELRRREGQALHEYLRRVG